MDEYHRPLPPVGQHVVTTDSNIRNIPDGCYNTGEGFYNPNTKCLYSISEPEQILRIPTRAEEQWIMRNCPRWDSRYSSQSDNNNNNNLLEKNIYGQWTDGRSTRKRKFTVVTASADQEISAKKRVIHLSISLENNI